MTQPRTLPLRLEPLPGEALDSWLEALAHRLHTPLGNLMAGLGLPARKGRPRPAERGITLLAQEAAAIAFATGVSSRQINAMTNSHYQGTALMIDSATGLVNRSALWGRGRGSRFCPDCLAANGGRWQLWWRLGWAFVCPWHRRLLADNCPACERPQRREPPSRYLVPALGRCGNPRPGQANGSRVRCPGDLTAAHTLVFPESHPALSAQRRLLGAIAADRADFGVYANHPQPVARMLADVRALGACTLDVPPAELADRLPHDLITAHQDATRRDAPVVPERITRPGFMAPPHAATAALAVTAALHLLAQPDFARAGAAMRPLLDDLRERRSQISTTTVDEWGQDISPVLQSVHLAALGPSLRPSFQLRYRTVNTVPRRPAHGDALSGSRADRTPSMLWRSWALRLSPEQAVQLPVLQSVLSAALLLVGTHLEQRQAAYELGSATDALTISRILQVMQDDPCWPAVHLALDRLADHLDHHPGPIDYARRRRLRYDHLLPEEQWQAIARSAGITPGLGRRGKVARCILFQRLSGLPVRLAPAVAREDDYQFGIEITRFAKVQTPELAAALTQVGQSFLTDNGIHEPTDSEPPADLLVGLDLPGPDPHGIDPDRLHRLVRVDNLSLRRAAHALTTTTEAAHHRLDQHPAPGLPRRRRSNHGTGRVMHAARAALPDETLRHLYEVELQSFRNIAERTGFTLRTISRLAHEYGIAVRPPQGRRRTSIERDWLFEQYVSRKRPLPELAREKGISVSAMNVWAHRHDIPLRPPGGASHRTFFHPGESKRTRT
ncbi:TniQ family protein [Streptomycetaceae bacterium NBC_01309]